MKLKHLAIIDLILSIIFVIIAFPVILIVYTINLLKKPFKWILDEWVYTLHRITNGMVKYADEVRSGEICNEHLIRNCTAKELYSIMLEQNN